MWGQDKGLGTTRALLSGHPLPWRVPRHSLPRASQHPGWAHGWPSLTFHGVGGARLQVHSPVLLGYLLGTAERQILASSVELLALKGDNIGHQRETAPKAELQAGQGSGFCFARESETCPHPCSLLAHGPYPFPAIFRVTSPVL